MFHVCNVAQNRLRIRCNGDIGYLLVACKQFLMTCVSFYSSDDESDAVFLHVSSADEGQKHQYRSGSIALLIPNVD
jgi:hypothetical protein